MISRDPDAIDKLIEKRVLFYFNQVRSIKEITEVPWGDSGMGWGVDYGIGEKAAHQIIEYRNNLPRRRFVSMDQLMEVPGLGREKIQDILYTLRIPSAEAFRRAMYRHVITDNFELSFYAITFDTSAEFQEAVQDAGHLENIVSQHVKFLAHESATEEELLKAQQQVLDAYVESVKIGYLASYIFAIWFYSFDLDNWFSFEQVREITEQYLDITYLSSDEQSFHLFKGFDNALILKGGRTVSDLPVVVNHDEKIIYLWACTLFD